MLIIVERWFRPEDVDEVSSECFDSAIKDSGEFSSFDMSACKFVKLNCNAAQDSFMGDLHVKARLDRWLE